MYKLLEVGETLLEVFMLEKSIAEGDEYIKVAFARCPTWWYNIKTALAESKNISTNNTMVPCLKYHNDGCNCVVLFAGKKCGKSPCLLAQHCDHIVGAKEN